ncbi:MAG: hypothetical protein P4N60_19215 [Verrucomicrobiae bacterium]|nr:hypothetical protein [Verrucomicrobiae bacterium]
MTDPTVITNAVGQAIETAAAVKSQFSPYLPALAVAAAWAGREIRNVNIYLESVASKIIAHGGIWQIVKKIWNNPSPK